MTIGRIEIKYKKDENNSNNDFEKKYRVSSLKYFYLNVRSSDFSNNVVINQHEIEEDIESSQQVNLNKKEFEFSKVDKKINRPLYNFQKAGLEVELSNEAVEQIDEILELISNSAQSDESIPLIQEKVDEINRFIDKHNLTFKKVNDKKRKLNLEFNNFCKNIEESKFSNLKKDVSSIYNDLFNLDIDIDNIGRKYPNFFSRLCEDDVFEYANMLIKQNSEFASLFKEVINCFIEKYSPIILGMYNSIIKQLNSSVYINQKEFFELNGRYEMSIKYLTNLNILRSYFNDHNQLKFKTIDIEKHVENHNKKVINDEYIENKDFFDNFNGHSLDADQRKVVLCDEFSSKVIAGAGSGKTFTLQAKLKYLLDFKNVNQNKILCISFSNAAVNDLKEKIKETIGENEIDTLTFHSLGGRILKENNEDYIPNKHLLNQTIEEYFEKDILSDANKIKKIIDFFNLYNYNSKIDEDDIVYFAKGNLIEIVGGKFETLKNKVGELTDYDFHIQNNNSIEDIRTVDRQFVRSFEELIIANFLFINNIDYIYEDNFFKRKNIAPDEEYTQYRPDFYLPKYDIYIEHYGVDRHLNAIHLDLSSRKTYKESIYWKREIHKKHNSCLIETYSFENKDGVLLKNLEEKLRAKGVEFSEIDFSRIYDRLVRNKKLDDLNNVIKVIERFIELFKTNGFNIDDEGRDISEKSFDEILSKINASDGYLRTRNTFLFDIIKDIYELYNKKEEIDFADMINNPIRLLNRNCKLKDYDYIFVDEYQDTSYSRYRLLREIIKRTNAKSIVVGDDWQSIYSFNGCDIDLFTNFENYFDYSKEFKIQKNYRNSSDLIDVSSSFILENKSQLEKDLIADKTNPKNAIKIAKYRYVKNLSLIFEDIIKEISHYHPNGEILVLGRYNDDFKKIIIPGLFETDSFYSYEKALKEEGFLKIKYMENRHLDIKFRSIHKSKGLQADNVIIIGMDDDEKRGFPTKITDDSIIQFVLTKSEEKAIHAEERRLFYVALTRSKNNVYIIVNEKKPSVFIGDLLRLDKENKLELREYRFNEKDEERMQSFMDEKFNKRTPYETKLKCNKCGKGKIIVYKKGTGKGFLRCSNCNFDFGAYNQSPEFIDSLAYCNVEGCNGLTYIKKDDDIERKICTYYGKTGCDGGNDE